MDWLEKEWDNKPHFSDLGLSDDDAKLLSRIKTKMERDPFFINRIKAERFDGFYRWFEINCRDINYSKDVLRSLWDYMSYWLSI